MRAPERAGCLTVLLRLIGFAQPNAKPEVIRLPFRLRDGLLTPAELNFYRVLATVVGARAAICPKVRLVDLFAIEQPSQNKGASNRISQKHVDFVLCDPSTFRFLCGVELDDTSHSRGRRKERDELVDGVFAAAGLPLFHIPAKSSYSPAELRGLLDSLLNGSR
ncbi:MAG: DUF2726 domain-containing protein [Planctomycetaceae bacterium]|nr:DUF2726 domain-containing protein [Planctomycetaceae bacterium]